LSKEKVAKRILSSSIHPKNPQSPPVGDVPEGSTERGHKASSFLRENRLGAQATQDCPKDRLKSEHRDCGWVGRRFGFSARVRSLPLGTEVFYFFRLRAEADETEQKITFKNEK